MNREQIRAKYEYEFVSMFQEVLEYAIDVLSKENGEKAFNPDGLVTVLNKEFNGRVVFGVDNDCSRVCLAIPDETLNKVDRTTGKTLFELAQNTEYSTYYYSKNPLTVNDFIERLRDDLHFLMVEKEWWREELTESR